MAAVNFVFVISIATIVVLIPGVVDGVNGVTKTKLTAASARQMKMVDKNKDVKKLDPSTMKAGEMLSPAMECQRWLKLEGT